MFLITDKKVFDEWERLSGNVGSEPFETVALRASPFLVAAAYSSLFDTDVLTACCRWSRMTNNQEIIASFLSPDPHEYRRLTGNYGAIVFSGEDDVASLSEGLFASQEANGSCSIYDISERMFIFPRSREWMLIGEREADLALLGFKTHTDAEDFSDLGGGIKIFASLEEGADYARSFMNYEVRRELLTSSRHP